MSPLNTLRQWMEQRQIDALVIPHDDEYLNEYVPPQNERLAWATGFTGSAGVAVILKDKAVLFADGRYTLQAREQAAQGAEQGFEVIEIPQTMPLKWLEANLPESAKLAVDPWMHRASALKAYEKAFGDRLVLLEGNPVDQLWKDRPIPAPTPMWEHEVRYAGRARGDKLADVVEALKKSRLDAYVLTDQDSIAWLLNVRGGDIPYNPYVLSRAILYADGHLDWFLDPAKIDKKVAKTFPKSISIHHETDFEAGLRSLSEQTVGMAFDTTPAAVRYRLEAAEAIIKNTPDPCGLPKACKNKIEQMGVKKSHARDGVAVTRFLYWVSQNAVKDGLDEVQVAQKLDSLRAQQDLFVDLSFNTISAAGENSAKAHYSASPDTARPLKDGEVYLVDSGGHYLDGTTDITRTIWMGDAKPPKNLKEHFTHVLKGHIALSTAQFPEGTDGRQLDVLARQYLWAEGLDFSHGTGHGVGCCGNVHQSPPGISPKRDGGALKPGMLVSNEPGLYLEGQYGIRLENLLLVQPAEKDGWLKFEPVTLAPFDTRLIDETRLTPAEKDWLTAYHQQVAEILSKNLTTEEKEWLNSILN